jgi:hypothetical protein
MEQKNIDPHLLSFVMMFSSLCWQNLGKVPNPVSGKTERQLDGAKMSIDMLCMFRDKTKGNLTGDEEKFISNVISDLQINYADEVNKNPEKQQGEAEKKEEGQSQGNPVENKS